MTMAGRVGWTAAALAWAAAVTVAAWPATESPVWVYVPLRLFGFVAIVIGYLAWNRPAWSRCGHLIVLLGATYYLEDLQFAAAYPIGFCLAYLWTAVLAHLVLTWPSGRAASASIRVLVAVCYAAAVGSQVARYLVDAPAPRRFLGSPYDHTTTAKVGSALVTALAVVVVLVVAHRWLHASAVRRGAAGPVWTAVVIVGVLATLPGIAGILGLSVVLEHGLRLGALAGAVLLVPVIVFARNAYLARLRWRLTALVLDPERELDLPTDPGAVQRALAAILRDERLRLAYPLPGGSSVDVHGLPFRPSPDRALTTIRRKGEAIALLEHDEALRDVDTVIATTEAVAGLAIESARRYALLLAQVEQIRTSRLRLATVAFEERHRIQRDLHDGAQQQLLAVLVLLDLAQRSRGDATGTVRQAHHQLKDAIASLRHLTQGIYPAALVEHGLAAAVEGLADVAPIPVSFTIPRTRWPRHLEATAYFTISEALANIYKHADAGHVRIEVRQDERTAYLEIIDDGRGGADPAGSGLSGLKDRVNTVNGVLRVESTADHGTRITTTFPLEAP